ncbi:hypothetical protein [Sulfurirhabdus autotrophica]|uniref:Periplasmic binding family protein n=1 Tax=Sulfurirhabdus autotrophica TaxID=1706046 RepID=A0A4R3Y8M8_9PROT|nr:hypothetical protein [Sulfurirhabdus autotrophica]TCV88210.1 hypothetical protein EDC63_104167 [Sulfurirhabdus autotrophica]
MKLINLFLANAMTLLACQAFAHGPTVTPDLEVFISGSSALQKTLGKTAGSMMQAGTIDVYYDNTSGGSNYRAYFGTVNGTGTALDGKKVLIHESAVGGSLMGVTPVAKATAISRMKIETATCTSTGAAYPSATYNCSATVNAVPDAGVSDMEPSLFVGSNLPIGTVQLNQTELGHLFVQSQNAVVYGIAVSDNVYANVTNLSRFQITSLLTGSYQEWGPINPSLAGHFVRVERRVSGSGTQASANAFFGGYPCSSGSVALADASFSNAGQYEVAENASSGNVISSLNSDFAANKYAIGLLSTDNVPGASDHWHFVSIDGVSPTIANVIAGKYDYFLEQTIQWRSVAVNGVAAPSGNMDLFLSTFKVRSGDPIIIATLPGLGALPGDYLPLLDSNYNVTNGVMRGTRQANTCSPYQLFF